MCGEFGFVNAGPDEGVIISGFPYGDRGRISDSAIVWPCIQTVTRIPLSMMTVIVETARVYTRNGVSISVSSVVQVSPAVYSRVICIAKKKYVSTVKPSFNKLFRSTHFCTLYRDFTVLDVHFVRNA